MNAWDIYDTRMGIKGGSRRESAKRKEQDYIHRKLSDSLSFFNVKIIDTAKLTPGLNRRYSDDEMRTQEVAILNSDNYEIKTLITLPGEDIRHGDLVDYMGYKWIVTEKDYNTEMYTKCKLLQCNYLLRWVDQDGNLYEQWTVIEDGTKLRRTISARGLAYWKRYAKRIPLIAGISLEPYHRNGGGNARRHGLRTIWIGQPAAKLSFERRFNDYPGCGSRNKRSEMGNPKLW